MIVKEGKYNSTENRKMKVNTLWNKELVAGMIQVELDISALLWANISQFSTTDFFFVLNLNIDAYRTVLYSSFCYLQHKLEYYTESCSYNSLSLNVQ